MSKYKIVGGNRLKGEVLVGGAKNAVLPILSACVLCGETIVLKNCPQLSDVTHTIELMRLMGCCISRDKNTVTVNCKGINTSEMPREYSEKMRSSIFMLGPLTSKMKWATAFYPGGCEIGLRPIDLHLSGLMQLGVAVTEEGGRIVCDGRNMSSSNVVLDYPSVGATENVLMASVLTKGETVIHNAAREPEIEDLQNFLNTMGAKVHGAGTGKIVINGVEKLHGGEYTVMGDRIVAGTMLVAGAITRGNITVKGANPQHLQSVLVKLEECGCKINAFDNAISLEMKKRPTEIVAIDTAPYPAFPTDMQAQFFALCCICKGTGIITENVFENRFKHGGELMKMGANIVIKGRMAVIRGVDGLVGNTVDAMDLRGGAALVLAGLCAKGDTVVNNSRHIKRGYENIDAMLRGLGGDITED